MKEIIVLKGRFSEFEKQVAWINLKARKFGIPEVTYKISETNKRVVLINDREVVFTEHTVELEGLPIKMNGWTFGAVVETLGSERIIKSVPGFVIPEKFYHGDSYCDHCQTLRMRKNVYLVHNESTGEVKQVGSTCIKDFVGHDLNNLLYKIYDFLDEDFRSGSQPEEIVLSWFLEMVQGLINIRGWLSNSKAREFGGFATSGIAWDYSALNIKYLENEARIERKEALDSITDEDKNFVKDAIEWAASISRDDKNDYKRNIGIIARHNAVDHRMAGFAGSILIAYKNELNWKKEKEEKEKNKKNEKPSNWVGEIKKRQEFDVFVKSVKSIETDFGPTGIHNMKDKEGNLLVWFASCTANWLKEGKEYHIKATVKSHGDYNGKKQTIINRVKELETVKSD